MEGITISWVDWVNTQWACLCISETNSFGYLGVSRDNSRKIIVFVCVCVCVNACPIIVFVFVCVCVCECVCYLFIGS